MCELVDVTDQPYVRKLFQDLVFFIGPIRGETLANEAEFDDRMEDAKQLFKSDSSGTSLIETVLEMGLGQDIKTIVASRTTGGMRGTLCPNVCIDAVASQVVGGRAFVTLINKEGVLRMCKLLQTKLYAEWTDAWYHGQFSKFPNFQVQHPAMNDGPCSIPN